LVLVFRIVKEALRAFDAGVRTVNELESAAEDVFLSVKLDDSALVDARCIVNEELSVFEAAF
jgi:hypothetical protein